MGTFSYSLYLVHVPLGRVINLGTRVISHDSVWFIFLIAAYWAVAVTGAWAFYRICEAPLERWRHHLRKKPFSIKNQAGTQFFSMKEVLRKSVNLIPLRARHGIKHLPGIAAGQRWLVNRVLSGEPFVHTINAGPARG